jgi:hypothetical protein
MPKKVCAWDGLQNLSPEDWPATILDSPLAMRPSINDEVGDVRAERA